MPTISEFYGIKIYMYWDEHNPPHFHAECAEFKAIILINEGVVSKGYLPRKQLKFVLAWAEIHFEELLQNWNLAQNNNSLIRIKPLR